MKTLITILIATTMSLQSIATTITPDFLDRLALVESNRDDAAINEREGAHGRYQIRQCYLDDANRILGSCYDLWDMHDPVIARIVVTAYLTHYGLAMERATGREATEEDLARIHNGGPRGWAKDSTADYGRRFSETSEE